MPKTIFTDKDDRAKAYKQGLEDMKFQLDEEFKLKLEQLRKDVKRVIDNNLYSYFGIHSEEARKQMTDFDYVMNNITKDINKVFKELK